MSSFAPLSEKNYKIGLKDGGQIKRYFCHILSNLIWVMINPVQLKIRTQQEVSGITCFDLRTSKYLNITNINSFVRWPIWFWILISICLFERKLRCISLKSSWPGSQVACPGRQCHPTLNLKVTTRILTQIITHHHHSLHKPLCHLFCVV